MFVCLFCFVDKTIRRKRSRKSFLPDQRSSDSQIGSSNPVVYVSSSMIDIQQTLNKSSPKSEIDHDNNPLLISDDDNDPTKKESTISNATGGGGGGGGEDECAVDGGTCLKPSGSSIKCKLNY